MRRRLLIIAIFLLAGAVVNVAVAWGLAAGTDGNNSNLSDAAQDIASLRRSIRPVGRHCPDPLNRARHPVDACVGPFTREASLWTMRIETERRSAT